jgi:CIC family chloride channel protein
VKTAPATLTIEQARAQFPIGSLKNFAVVDENNRYAGMVMLDDLHTTDAPADAQITTVMRHKDALLLPWMTVREALDVFESAESDALIVVDQATTRRIVGVLSESNALRSYGRELERQSPDNVMRFDPLADTASRR